MAEGISVPVRLQIENLKTIIDTLKQELGNLKIGSSGFKTMQNTIHSLEREFDKLQIQASKPFITANQFNQANKSVEKIEDQIEQLQINASRIKFSDLELNGQQKAELEVINNQIVEMKNNLKKIKQDAKASFLNSDMGKIWSDMHPEDTGRSLEQITNKIRTEVAKQNTEVKKAEETMNAYRNAIKAGDIASDLTKAATKGKGALTDFLKDFVTTNAKGITSFKSGGRSLLGQWLEQNLQIDPSVVRELVSQTSGNVLTELQNTGSKIRQELDRVISQGTDANSNLTGSTQAYSNQKALLDQLANILARVMQENDAVGESEENMRSKISDANIELEKTQERFVNAARGSTNLSNGCRNAISELNNMKNALAETNVKFLEMERTRANFNAIKMAIVNFMGFRQVINLVSRGVKEALNHIKELDTVMNNISIVTNMSTGDLWSQVDAYSQMAQKYGASIKGAYEVSQIYYQQGLQTADVMTLTNETLKLAKISGLDYAQTTDYMTTALRGFKMEMSEASRVVDVYSNLAAHTAATQEELAVAMSKTASSLESVGVTFEEGSAMIGTMVAVTRESATNIGSALKSIASRYGEMKSDPLKLVDAEGDALSYNKVDAALQSVGISLKNTNGQFRNMSDVIMELAEVWDQLDTTQQRYIATQFAGNRQQSRFLALVSNKDLLKANLGYAEESEDTGTIQALKALDSIESKTEQVRVAYQQMYTTLGAESIWKGALDGAKNFINTLNGMPKLFGKIPLGAINMIYDIINVLKTVGFAALGGISKIWDQLLPDTMPEKAGKMAQSFAESFGSALLGALKGKDLGGEISDEINREAQQAGNDQNRLSGKEKLKEGAEKPAQEVTKEKVQQTVEIKTEVQQGNNQASELKNELDQAAKYAEQIRINLTNLGLSAEFTPIVEGIRNAVGQTDFSDSASVEVLKEKVKAIVSEAGDLGQDFAAQLQKVGENGIEGLIIGITSKTGEAFSIGSAAGKAVIEGVKEGAGTHSPSVFAIMIGENIITGLANGINNAAKDAISAAKETGKAIITEFDDALLQSPNGFEAFKMMILDQIESSNLTDDVKSVMKEKIQGLKNITELGSNQILNESAEEKIKSLNGTETEKLWNRYNNLKDFIVDEDTGYRYNENTGERQSEEEYQAEIEKTIQALKEKGEIQEEVGDKAKEAGEEAVKSEKEDQAATEETIKKKKEKKDTSVNDGRGNLPNNSSDKGTYNKIQDFAKNNKRTFTSIASGLNMIGGMIGTETREQQIASGTLQSASGAINLGVGIATGDVMSMVRGGIALYSGISTIIEDDKERLERLKKEAEEATNKAKIARSEYKELQNAQTKLQELEKKRYDSAEDAEAYQEAVDGLIEKFPQLSAGFDAQGNAIMSLVSLEYMLTEARRKTAEATLEAAESELKKKEEEKKQKEKDVKTALTKTTNRTSRSDETRTNRLENAQFNSEYKINAESMMELFERAEENQYVVKHATSGHVNWLSNWLDNVSENAEGNKESYFFSMQNYLNHYLHSISHDDTKGISPFWDSLKENKGDYLVSYGKYSSVEAGEKQLKLYQYYKKNFDKLTENDLLLYEVLNSMYGTGSDEGDELVRQVEEAQAELINLKTNKEATADDITAAYNKFKAALEKLLTSTDVVNANIKNRYIYLYETYGELSEALIDYGSANLLYESGKLSLISAQQHYAGTGYKYVDESSQLVGIISENIRKQIDEDYKGNYTKYIEKGFLAQGASYMGYADAFWKSLNEEEQKKFNEMAGKTSIYTGLDIVKAFSSRLRDDKGELTQMGVYIINAYDNMSEQAYTLIERNLNSSNLGTSDIAEKLKQYQKNRDLQFNDSYVQLINRMIEQTESITKAGLSTQPFLETFSSLFDSIIKLEPEIRETLISSILQNGVNTKLGIDKILTDLESLPIKNDHSELYDEIVDEFDTLKSQIVNNLTLSLNTMVDELMTNWKTTSEKFQKALSTGIESSELDSVIEEVKSLGITDITRDDFKLQGTKWVLKNKELYEKYWNAFNKSYNNLMEESENALKDAREFVSYILSGDSTNLHLYQSKFTALLQSGTLGIDLNDYTDDNGKFMYDKFLQNVDTDELNKAIGNFEKLYLNTIANYINLQQEILNSQLKYGDFSSIEKSLDLNQGAKSAWARLLELAGGEKYSPSELLNENVKETVKGIQSSLSNLLNDILSNGIDSINLEDYDYISTNVTDIFGKKTYESIIREYAKKTGKTLAEVNDLFLNAIEKDNEKVSLDAIKDLQFIDANKFTATKDELSSLAKIYNIDLMELFDAKLVEFDEVLGEYVIDLSDIDSIQNTELKSSLDKVKENVENFQEEVADSIDSFFEELTNLIKDGLTGSLKNADIKKLQTLAKQLGIEINDLGVIKTANGFQLSNNSALSIIGAIGKRNGAQGAALEQEYYKNLTSLFSNAQSGKLTYDEASYLNVMAKEYEMDILKFIKTADGLALPNQSALELINKISGNNPIYGNSLRKDYTKNVTTLFNNAVNGTLDETSIEQLRQMVGEEVDLFFTETAEGWQIEGKSALQVLQKIKSELSTTQYNSLFESLLPKLEEESDILGSSTAIIARNAELAEKIQQTSKYDSTKIDQYKKELELNEQILKIRSTQEDSSFNFMSNSIPGAQNNPINYFNNWASAIQKLRDAMKTKSTTADGVTHKGLLDYQDWYNIVTEMNNIAALGQDIEIAGITLDGSMEAAAALIQKGAEALTVDSTGNVKVALGDIGVEFEAGAGDMASGIDAGIKSMAESQVTMLDGLIKVLEAIVTMQELGDITGTDDTIDVGDLFPEIDWEEGETKVVKNEKAFKWIEKFLANKDYQDVLDNLVIKGTKLREWMTNAIRKGLTKEQANDFSEVMNTLYQMSTSTEYDLNDLYGSLQQLMGKYDLSGTFTLGDQTLIIEKGAVIIETKDKNKNSQFQTPDGKTFSNKDEALAYAAMSTYGIDVNSFSYDAGTATGTLTIGETVLKIKRANDGKVAYTDGTITGTSLSDYVHNRAIEDAKTDEKGRSEEQIEFELSVQYKLTPLDSFTYKGLSEKVRQDLETALASGKQTEVDKVIKLNPVLSSLAGKTGQEIIEQLRMDDLTITVQNTEALESIKSVSDALATLQDKTITITTIRKEINSNTSTNTFGAPSRENSQNKRESYTSQAIGNIGNAKAKGTLLGELGPELVVSGGRYFVAGQSGPEMINLADDAIVFNHLQTKSLLEKGMSTGRGKAVTNEYNATAFAKGSIHGGPAMASAAAALHALKQLRSEWQALAGLTAQDLAGKAGGGGGEDKATFIKDLERWYNLLQEIAKLEEKITYEEAKRSKIASDFNRDGKEYFNSQQDSLKYLEREVQIQQQLTDEQQKYFNIRRNELNKQSAFSALYTFDESGQIKYASGKFAELSNMFGSNSVTGEANYTVQEQYDWLISQGYGYAMKYNENGEEIEAKGESGMKSAIEAFWAKIEADKTEMQELHDSIEEHKKAVLEKQQAANEILKQIEDNQIAVEDRVLKAIEDAAQREIDTLQDERDAIETSNKAYIDGLTRQLENQRNLYENAENDNELSKLYRRLNILQRSGASAAEIASLQEEISTKSSEIIFDKQQDQIDAIQNASDAQLEKLDQQITILTEQLAYQKEYGLLWNKVYEVMDGTPDEITSFITENNSEFWGKSIANFGQEVRQIQFENEQWKAFSENGQSIEEYAKTIADAVTAGSSEAEKSAAESAAAETASTSSTSSTDSSGTNNGAGEWKWIGKASEWKYDNTYHWKEQEKQNTVTGQKITVELLKDKHSFPGGVITGGATCKCGYKLSYYTPISQSETKTEQQTSNTISPAKETARKINDGYFSTYDKETSSTKTSTVVAENQQNESNNHGYTLTVNGTTYTDTGYYSKEAAQSAANSKLNEVINTLPQQVRNDIKKAAKMNVYDTGGMVEQDGPAIVHAKEAVLTAKQASTLRNDILGSNPNSLMNLLLDFRNAYTGIGSNTYNSANNSEAVVIENATVEMNVSQIANDYDAQRAGEKALEQMLQIARRTSAKNSIRG